MPRFKVVTYLGEIIDGIEAKDQIDAEEQVQRIIDAWEYDDYVLTVEQLDGFEPYDEKNVRDRR
jgi:hypothetical protein